MNQESQQQIQLALGFLSRKRRYLMVSLLVALIAGLVFYLKSPKRYQATALIMYQQQQINPTRMSPDVQTRTREMINTVGEQVTSRTSLEELISQFDLYSGLRAKLPMEDVITIMRDNHISINPGKGDVFEVSFVGSDPQKVMKVTNALAAKFIEENIRFREERVTETSAYIEEELGIAKAALDKKEASMRDYKLKYYNEMPEQREANITRLNALQEQQQNIQSSIQDFERTKVLIQEQMTRRKELLQQTAFGSAGIVQGEGGSRSAGITDPVAELIRLRQELEALRTKYTDNHPDVKRLQKRLAALEEAQGVSAADAEGAKENGDQHGERAGDILRRDSQLAQLEMQLKEIEYNVTQLKAEREENRKLIEQYQEWVAATPIREAEWAALTRDYNQLQQHYQELVAGSLAAESAETLERRQKGSQFKIVDPAHFPEKPFQPNFRKIMLLAVGLGLGVGGGVAFAFEFLDTSFKEVTDLEQTLDLPVACTIPLIRTETEKTQLRIRTIIWNVALIITFAVLAGGMLVLWKKGLIII